MCFEGEEEGAACSRERRELLIPDKKGNREKNVAFKNAEDAVCVCI
jgi:hypothetical protein